MKDVARRAGVNQSTVSRVLGGAEGASISAEVRRRIRRIARLLDYHRNPSAVALRTGSTRTVMVVVSDMTDVFYSTILSGVQEVLGAEGYALVLHSLAHAGPPDDLPLFIRRFHFDGVLMLGALPGIGDGDLASLARRGIPLVLVGRVPGGRSHGAGLISSVTAANAAGGRLAAGHLWDLGHRRIAVMRGLRGWPDITQRIEGFQGELAGRGAVPGTVRLFPCGSRQARSGFAAAARLLSEWNPTALFCLNDATAIGSMSAVRVAGLRVPEDVSVVGFDDGESAEFAAPPLTTVRQPRLRMGREGARELVQAMRGKGARAGPRALDVELVVRRSTCPPP